MANNYTEMLKKSYQAVVIVLILNSCVTKKLTYNPKIINKPLLETPQKGPFVIESSQSYENSWNTTLAYFSKKGIVITLNDKTKGILIAANTRFTNNTHTVFSNSVLLNPNAYVVINDCYEIKGRDFKDFKPMNIEGDWSVQISRMNSKTMINISLINSRAETMPREEKDVIYTNPCKWDIASTGVFEKGLAQVFSGE